MISLSWNAYTNATLYGVYRSSSGANYVLIAVTSDTTYNDGVSGEYYYYVIAFENDSPLTSSNSIHLNAPTDMIVTIVKSEGVDAKSFVHEELVGATIDSQISKILAFINES